MRLFPLILGCALALPASAGWVRLNYSPGASTVRSGCVVAGQYERSPVSVGVGGGQLTITNLPDGGRCYFAQDGGDELYFDFDTLANGSTPPGPVPNFAVTWKPTPPPAAVTITLTVDPASLDHVTTVITGTSSVTLTATGGQQWDWLKSGATSQGVGGTTVPTVPAIGGNQDGVQAVSIVVTGPVNAVADVDPSDFVGATATVSGVTKPFVKSGNVYSVSF